MRFSSPGQTRRRLTEKRILLAWGVAECAFRSRRRPRGAGRNPPPACGALWRMPQLGKRARATPRQAAGGVAPGPAGLGRRARPHGKAQSGQRASLMARPGPGRGTIRLPVAGSGGARNSGLEFALSAPMACHAWAQKRTRIAPTSRSPDDLRDSCTLLAELTRVQRVP